MHLRHIISLGLFLMSLAGSGGAWAVQCPSYEYNLSTQAQVDAFPQDCDSVSGYILIRNSNDITNVDSLSNITSVAWSLQISNNTALPNIDGLVNLTSVGGICLSATGIAVVRGRTMLSSPTLTGLLTSSAWGAV